MLKHPDGYVKLVQRNLDAGSAEVARRLAGDLLGVVSQGELFDHGNNPRERLLIQAQDHVPDMLVVPERVLDHYRYRAGVEVSGIPDNTLADDDTRRTSYMARNRRFLSPLLGDITFDDVAGIYIGPLADLTKVLGNDAKQIVRDRLAGHPLVQRPFGVTDYAQQTLPIHITAGEL